MRFSMVIAGLFGLALAGCVQPSTATVTEPEALPLMRWDHRAEADQWTEATLATVAQYDAALAGRVPADVAAWCPGYESASLEERRAFWVAMFSALAKHESTWNPAAAGGGGRWIGLTQISPATARQYDCEAQSVAALKDGTANLACAVRIAAAQVGRDGLVAGGGNRGMGRDWAPFRAASKRADMAGWVSDQAYCQRDL
ncbi:MAG: transglycosylase SLT domain-containing protein [Rhodobacteraceae bacterium]|nr:transglycosylase SLT domain-containing protein [Paracoccaceae bacterium]